MCDDAPILFSLVYHLLPFALLCAERKENWLQGWAQQCFIGRHWEYSDSALEDLLVKLVSAVHALLPALCKKNLGYAKTILENISSWLLGTLLLCLCEVLVDEITTFYLRCSQSFSNIIPICRSFLANKALFGMDLKFIRSFINSN